MAQWGAAVGRAALVAGSTRRADSARTPSTKSAMRRRKRRKRGNADMCPSCHSDDIRIAEFDRGIDPETGYHDAGVLVTFRVCGATHDGDDINRYRSSPNSRTPLGHCRYRASAHNSARSRARSQTAPRFPGRIFGPSTSPETRAGLPPWPIQATPFHIAAFAGFWSSK